MARDRANIRLNLWADEDWRNLSIEAQHLYLMLLSHPSLSYAGVADWRPKRLAPLTGTATPEGIEDAAQELQSSAFVYADEDTEEILIRSFVRHDGVIRHPKLRVSMANDYAAISSSLIREFVAFELQRLSTEEPDLPLWEHPSVKAILKATARDMRTHPQAQPKPNPSLSQGNAKAWEQVELSPSDSLPTTTATATSPKGDAAVPPRRAPERPLPESWEPNEAHKTKCRERNIDIAHEVERFHNHAKANDRRQRDWDAAFHNWLTNAKPRTAPAGRPTQASWMIPRKAG